MQSHAHQEETHEGWESFSSLTIISVPAEFYIVCLTVLSGQVMGGELNGKPLFYLNIIYIYFIYFYFNFCKFKINLKYP